MTVLGLFDGYQTGIPKMLYMAVFWTYVWVHLVEITLPPAVSSA